MITVKVIAGFLVAFAGLLSSTANSATIVYSGSQQIGSIFSEYSITTNGNLGDLTDADIVNFDVTLTDSLSTIQYSQSNGFANGSFFATSTTLSQNDGFLDFVTDAVSSYGYFAGLLDFGSDNSFAQISDAAHGGVIGQSSSTPGNRIAFALVGSPASPVPEPASWALMIAGFGAIGFTMRHRKVAIAALSFS